MTVCYYFTALTSYYFLPSYFVFTAAITRTFHDNTLTTIYNMYLQQYETQDETGKTTRDQLAIKLPPLPGKFTFLLQLSRPYMYLLLLSRGVLKPELTFPHYFTMHLPILAFQPRVLRVTKILTHRFNKMELLHPSHLIPRHWCPDR